VRALSRRDRPPYMCPPWVRIAITPTAFDAVAATLPEATARGERLVWLETAVADRLTAMRQPGESMSAAILRLTYLRRKGIVSRRSTKVDHARVDLDRTCPAIGGRGVPRKASRMTEGALSSSTAISADVFPCARIRRASPCQLPLPIGVCIGRPPSLEGGARELDARMIRRVPKGRLYGCPGRVPDRARLFHAAG
jgi:hypothetical protein